MKGKLHKTEKGWFVSFPEQSIISVYNGSSITQGSVGILPLHPDDVKQIEKDSQVFDNIEARIHAYPDVEFYNVEECPHYGGKHFGRDCSCKMGFIRYAKLKSKD